MQSDSKRLQHKTGARFTLWDGLILSAAAALGVFFCTTRQASPDGQYFIFWALLVCAAVLIGVKHILTSMQRPFVALAWCLLGGTLVGGLSLFLAWSFVSTHPVSSHGEDYGAMATGILYLTLVFLSPIAGFLIGFPVTLAIYAVFQSKSAGPKPSEKPSHPE